MTKKLISVVLLVSMSCWAQNVSNQSPRKSVVHSPNAGTQATASVAASSGYKHVIDCVTFSAGSTTAPALTKLTVDVRDGATGAGTVKLQFTVVASNATGQNVAPHSVCGLNIVGSDNAAATVEFSASLANLFETVSFTYYDIPTLQ